MRIGPTFWSEVRAAGLAGLPFSVSDNGNVEDQGLTADQLSALGAVIEAHDPSKRGPRLATGKQLCKALADLGLLAAWDAAVQATHKAEDRLYWQSSYRDTVPDDSPKLMRIAEAASVDLKLLFTTITVGVN